jgi:hypothetical protein
MSADCTITLLHFGVVEHSAELLMVSISDNAKLTSLVVCLSTLAPLHSAHVWMRRYLRVVPHALGEGTLMCINTEVSCI